VSCGRDGNGKGDRVTRRASTGGALAIAFACCIAACVVPADARPTAATRCSDTLRVPARGPSLRADLDGDRRPDRVWVAGRKTADTECQFTVVVSGAGGWSAKRSVVPRDATSWIPRLVVLAAIDSTRGAEIVIEREQATDLGYALVLTLRNRRLVTLPAPRNPMNGRGVFTYSAFDAPGGAVQVDCPKPGTVVTSGFSWLASNDPYATDPRWYAERRTYRITGTQFRQVAATVLPSATRGEAEEILLPVGEYRPFVSCAVTPFL
jgi:hypothetical protein